MNEQEEKKKAIHLTIRERTSSYIIASLGIVAGLAWNDAIRTLIDYIFPASAKSIVAKFLYAVLITIVIVLLSVWIIRYLNPEKKNDA